jgi:hypothetical protein
VQQKTRRELGGQLLCGLWKVLEDSEHVARRRPLNDQLRRPSHPSCRRRLHLARHEDGAHDPDLNFSREYWTSNRFVRALSRMTSIRVARCRTTPLRVALLGTVRLGRYADRLPISSHAPCTCSDGGDVERAEQLFPRVVDSSVGPSTARLT